MLQLPVWNVVNIKPYRIALKHAFGQISFSLQRHHFEETKAASPLIECFWRQKQVF